MLSRRIFIFIIFIFTAITLPAQQELLKPVFPESSTGLIYIEGEDAVSTNFANQPVSNFGTSGYQAVQLSRNTGLQGGAAFYAEFVFYVEEAGLYEFWYGGTPPGPADELSPSYSSPFRYRLDGKEPVFVYREDMHVVEGYTPSYYWNSVGELELSEGAHTIRIEVAEQRRYDGRYYFYLDSLFFLNRERIDEIDPVKPQVFPDSLDNTAIDNPFLSITDYEGYIKENPDEMSAYIELSLVYSLLGDYQSALKTLNRAMALDSSDPYPVVLAAKNRLWKGDVRESLSLYERALTIEPGDKVLWAEAAKVSAWSAQYEKAIDFFTRGLERFPEDLNLQVNLGLTYLWMARDEDAESTFDKALKNASSDPEKLSELGWTEQVNGYPEYAQEVYEKSIELYPAYLDFYLLLQSSYLETGDRDAADEVGRRIESTFRSTPELQNVLEIYSKKLNLIDEVIASYLERLKAEPGNLELRQELAQTFFWNGMSREAVEQIKYVITTYGYRAAESFVRRNAEVMELIDLVAATRPILESYPAAAASAEKRINSAFDALNKAAAAVEKAASSAEAAPEQIAQTRKVLRAAEQEAADSVAAAQHLVTIMDDKILEIGSYEESVQRLLLGEKEEDEAFRAVISSSGWSWSKSWQIGELEDIYRTEPELASFLLSRVLISERRFSRAAEVLYPDAGEVEVVLESADDAAEAAAAEAQLPASILDYSEMSPDRLYTLYQALLLGGDDASGRAVFEAAGDQIVSDFPHAAKVEELLNTAAAPFSGAGAGVYFEGIAETSTEVLMQLDQLTETASAAQKKASLLSNQLFAVSNKELERANYYLEADTYLIRYELGTYYLDDGLNLEASEQFRRVVAVDPWNISAAYKLGIVEQRYGNWSEAMKYYKKVYQQDPGYENAVYYYNQLARSHADRIKSSFQLINTPAEISFAAAIGYSTEFNSHFGLALDYGLDQQRLYRAYEGEQQGSFQVHLLQASLPLTFNKIGLQLTPHAGVYSESIYYKTDMYFPAGATVSAGEFLKTLSAYPNYGFSLGWNYEFLDFDVSWERAVEADTFYEDRELVKKHDLQLNANTWFDFEQDLIGPLTTRTYGRLQFMDDANIKGQIYQDAMLGFNLSEKPIIRLSPSVSVNFENSLNSPGGGYYAPDNVLELKSGLRSAFTFPSSDWSRAFEAVIWGAGGGYWAALGSAASSGSAKVDGGIGLTFVKNSNTYYLNLAGSGTFKEGVNDYWELSVQLGTALNLPGVLTQ